MLPFLRCLLLIVVLPWLLTAQVKFDLVIEGGRVMDPETGLDAVRHVGIRDDKVAAISEEKLAGRTVLHASGLVVAPGFIDLHRHGHSPQNYRAQIHDGITTSLELEIGVEDIDAWYAERESKSLVNFGASISHPYSRQIVMTGRNPGLEGDALLRPATPEQVEQLKKRITDALERGAAGVGFGIAYTPGATFEEILAMFQVAARFDAPCHVHMRTNHEDFSNLEEVLRAAEQSGAALHVVHINSTGQDRAPQYLEIMRKAQARGVDVTTECYPYNRGSTLIQSHLFDDWETYSDEKFAGFTWVETGESLTRASFARYRRQGGTLITPADYSEDTVRALVASPLTMIASDGMWLDKGRAHPRTFGTYARVLGRYVREQQALSLLDALGKMALMPAQRLEKRVPAMRHKGRLKPGADADIVVFDPKTVIDRATYENPAQFSTGIRHVVVNGVVVFQDGNDAEGVYPGKPVRGPRITQH